MLSHTSKPHPRIAAWERPSEGLEEPCHDRLFWVTSINLSAGCLVKVIGALIEIDGGDQRPEVGLSVSVDVTGLVIYFTIAKAIMLRP